MLPGENVFEFPLNRIVGLDVLYCQYVLDVPRQEIQELLTNTSLQDRSSSLDMRSSSLLGISMKIDVLVESIVSLSCWSPILVMSYSLS